MNILHIMYQYHKLKTDPNFDMLPTTYFFGGKAAPGYYLAKESIRQPMSASRFPRHRRKLRERAT